MKQNVTAPPFDRELAPVLAETLQEMLPTITADLIPQMRQAPAPSPSVAEILDHAGLSTRDVMIDGHDGGTITVSVVQAKERRGRGPCLYYLHGGGMILGDRWAGLTRLTDWILRYNAVAVTVEYRLAPEFPDPWPIEDCYAGLLWIAGHGAELGVEAGRLIAVGDSSGGGLAAGMTLLSRDRQGPAAAGQLLMYPMLDDRDRTVSSQQIDGIGIWDRGSNRTGWRALLGDRCGTDDVSIYAAPARAADLSGLPPTYIDCGSAEVFRDEDVAYATAIWACGGDAELHVWPGGFHGFDSLAPQSALAQDMTATRDRWVGRLWG